MSYFKVSDFLKSKDIPPFVLGAFISRSIFDGDLIYTEASFRKNKFAKIDFVENKSDYLSKLNLISAPFVWTLQKTADTAFKANITLYNDLKLSQERFFYKLYYNLVTNYPWVLEDKFNEQKKYFIRGFMEPRGSIDANRHLIAQDYFFGNLFELKKYKMLSDFCNVPFTVLNLNFRELQEEFYQGTNPRNTQFRIHSKWYMKNIGMLNEYKADTYAQGEHCEDKMFERDGVYYFDVEVPNYSLHNKTDYKFNFYVHHIFNQNLSEQEIFSLRKSLGYDSSTAPLRDSSLADLVRLFDPDECVCCKNIYNIQDRTFIHKKTSRPYFEIHHVISLGNNKELDDENNLVKLCPVCHTCLKRGTGLETDQKKLIGNILDNSNKALRFAKNIFDCEDKNILINKIYDNLK